jgi:hypothetical protein
MKKFLLVSIALVILIVGVLLLSPNTAFAQSQMISPTPEQAKVVDIAPWLTSNQRDYGLGITLAVGGLVGALITMFAFIGGAFPGTAGKTVIDTDTVRLEILSDQLDKFVTGTRANADLIEAVEKMVNNFRDDLRSEKWRQFAFASIAYAVIGAAIAAFLASNLLQAIVIGAGWTGLLGSLGLKSDYAKRKAVKDSALDETVKELKEAQTDLPLLKFLSPSGEQLKLKSSTDVETLTAMSLASNRIAELERRVRLAKAL